jgi:hypothetical protein
MRLTTYQMRSVSFIFGVLLLAIALRLVPPVALLGQEPAITNVRERTYREWQTIANGRTDFEVSNPSQVPSLLVTAARQSGCRYEEIIATWPLRFLSVEKRRLALMPCFGFNGSNELFDLTDLTKPRMLEFPFIAQPEGFGTTSRPGAIVWKPDAKVFEAVASTDVCPSPSVRHTHRLADSSSYASDPVVVKVERKADRCGAAPWLTIWDAPRW